MLPVDFYEIHVQGIILSQLTYLIHIDKYISVNDHIERLFIGYCTYANRHICLQSENSPHA